MHTSKHRCTWCKTLIHNKDEQRCLGDKGLAVLTALSIAFDVSSYTYIHNNCINHLYNLSKTKVSSVFAALACMLDVHVDVGSIHPYVLDSRQLPRIYLIGYTKVFIRRIVSMSTPLYCPAYHTLYNDQV